MTNRCFPIAMLQRLLSNFLATATAIMGNALQSSFTWTKLHHVLYACVLIPSRSTNVHCVDFSLANANKDCVAFYSCARYWRLHCTQCAKMTVLGMHRVLPTCTLLMHSFWLLFLENFTPACPAVLIWEKSC